MAWGEFVPGVSVMGNAYPASGNRSQCAGSSSVHNDSDWDEEVDTERLTLLEENARLRALVVQLSNLVLRNVVDQHSTPQLVPMRRPRLD
jgi:hypothetical protein